MATFHSTLIKCNVLSTIASVSSADSSLSTVFERNFASELTRMGDSLEYHFSTATSPALSNGQTPEVTTGMLGASTSTFASHGRTFSTSTLTSSNTHLPFALPALGGIAESAYSPNLSISANEKSSLKHSTASYRDQGIDAPLRSPRSKLSMRTDRPHVNFALPNGNKDNGRLSPAPSNAPSIAANGIVDSGRPTSFLGRLASMRKKRT